MIHYLFMIAAVACFVAQFSFTKLYEESVGQTLGATLIMIAGTSLAGALIFFLIGGCKVAVSPISLIWAAVFAIIMIPYYMIGVKVLSIGSLAIYSMFMMLGGMLVPFFYGVLFLHEEISIGKILGTLLLTFFIILQAITQASSEEKPVASKTKCLFFILCLSIFFVNGMTGVIAKAHSISESAVDEVSFTVIYCTMTTLFGLILLLPSGMKRIGHGSIRKILRPKSILIMTLLGAATYGGNFFLLLAADQVPASVQFPLVSGGVILLSTLVSVLIFKEKIPKIEWCSVIGAFVSTFLFAF